MPSSVRTDSALGTSIHTRADTQLPQMDGLYHKPSSRMYNSREPAPFSPPYDPADAQRPLLPPLKLVLGDSMASPPRTPRITSIPSQPIPREPMYTADTYRPPSLYPNKKQRTEAFDMAPPFSTASSGFTSRPSTGFEPSPRGIASNPDLPHISPVSVPQLRGPDTRASQGAYPQHYPHDRSQPPPSMRGSNVTAEPSSSQRKERLHQTPHSAVSQRSWKDAHPDDAYSTQGFASYHSGPRFPHASDERYSQVLPQPPDTCYSPQSQGGLHRVQRELITEMHAGPSSGPFQHDHSTDAFVSGSYDYYYPKARKRSNLPKHSTEIMRAWFDQNIGNPYPSEDQKALFANATGISLTQVSNWFINHRRRCPELRDKRAERRKL